MCPFNARLFKSFCCVFLSQYLHEMLFLKTQKVCFRVKESYLYVALQLRFKNTLNLAIFIILCGKYTNLRFWNKPNNNHGHSKTGSFRQGKGKFFPAFPPPHALVFEYYLSFYLSLHLIILKFDHKLFWFKKVTESFDKSILFIHLFGSSVLHWLSRNYLFLQLSHFIFTNNAILIKPWLNN